MKIYAKQVPPEYQESPLSFGEWPENVFVYGNRYYNDHAKKLEEIKNRLEDALYEFERLQNGEFSGSYSFKEILNDFLPPEGRSKYTREERKHTWPALFEEWAETGTRDEREVYCDILALITGQEWEAGTIRGCVQGDWQNIIYPAKYGQEWLDAFETEYFNTGAEWRINEGSPDDDDNYYFYSHAWDSDGIRAEIAEATGVKPEDVILYEFTGWHREPEYKEVYA